MKSTANTSTANSASSTANAPTSTSTSNAATSNANIAPELYFRLTVLEDILTRG